MVATLTPRLSQWLANSARMPMRSAPLTCTRAKTLGGLPWRAGRTLTIKPARLACRAHCRADTHSMAPFSASLSGRKSTEAIESVPLTSIDREPPSVTPWPMMVRVKVESASLSAGPVTVATSLLDMARASRPVGRRSAMARIMSATSSTHSPVPGTIQAWFALDPQVQGSFASLLGRPGP
eukprot:scaffold15844_cov36-Phaeocystis_antarctica.AAC.1